MNGCDTCGGDGLCPECGGEGWVEVRSVDPGYDDAALRQLMNLAPADATVACESCEGSGECVECGGEG